MNITDPLGEREDGGIREDEAESSKLPRAGECYCGLYADFMPVGDDAQKLMANAAGYVGLELAIAMRWREDGEKLWISTNSGMPLAPVPCDAARKLEPLVRGGWNVRATLSLVTYSKSGGKFFAEAAIMCISPDCGESVRAALAEFESNQIRRIKGGDHPVIDLGQNQFAQVVESGGQWHATKMAKLSKEQRERMSFKRSQSLTGKMVDMSQDHRMGCAVASTIMLLGIAGFLIWLSVTLLF